MSHSSNKRDLVQESRDAVAAHNRRLLTWEPLWECVSCGEVFHDPDPDDHRRSPLHWSSCVDCGEEHFGQGVSDG